MKHHPLTTAAILSSVVVFFLYSFSDSMMRLLMLQGFSLQQMLASLMALALIPVMGMVTYTHSWGKLKPKHPKLILLRVSMSCAELFCAFTAFRMLQLAEAYALFFTMPIWAAILSALILKESLSRRQLVAILIGFAGVLASNFPTQGSTLGLGQVMGLTAPFLAALGMIIMRKIGNSENGGTLLGANLLALVAFNVATAPAFVPMPMPSLLILILAGLVTGCAHVMFLMAIRRAPAPLVAPFQYTQTLWGLVFGFIFFNEWPQPKIFLGLALIIAGGWILLGKKKAAKQG